MTTGRWSRNGFIARFRPDAGRRPHLQHFRGWLIGEARRTAEGLERIAKRESTARGPNG